jgi:hypothetical protein
MIRWCFRELWKHQTSPINKLENMVRHVAPNMYTFGAQLETQRGNNDATWEMFGFPRDATKGKIRVARRGSKAYFLFAAVDSSQFRNYHVAPFTMKEIPLGGLQLRVVSHGPGATTEVTFRNVSIAAQKIVKVVSIR